MSEATIAVELLLLAIIMAMASKHFRLPYTTALVVCGLGVGITHFIPLKVERDLILLVFLPPLLFEGALNMDLELLKEQWFPVALLALVGTTISALVIGFLLWIIAPGVTAQPVSLLAALFLGTILSATDPVSVLAMFKQYGVEKRLAIILEGESVFNDGIAVVLYLVMYDVVQAGGALPGGFDVLGRAASVAGGGIAIGLAVGWVTYRILAHIDDHLLEVMISVVLAWGSYVLAERLHMSGVLATACAGLIIGNYGRLFSMSPTTRVTLGAFWEVMTFIANSFVFILIGMQIDRASFARHWPLMLVVVVLVLASRVVVVFGLIPLTRAAGWSIPRSWTHVLNLGGLRGSIPIALALGLPATFPGREMFQTAVFGAVFFSLVAQGLMIKPLLTRLGLVGADARQREFERRMARAISLKAALRELLRMGDDGEVSPGLQEKLTQEMELEKELLTREIRELQDSHDFLARAQEVRARRRLLATQRSAIDDTFRKGLISEQVLEDSRREIDSLASELEVSARFTGGSNAA
ncbi:MAG: Na+/H+ antiporter [Candidatus Riflebacteria bacterium]|nr:Na+/H+ antiporter [Candidatus Riflebacteria bacterium]